jgi:hypothetical protein
MDGAVLAPTNTKSDVTVDRDYSYTTDNGATVATLGNGDTILLDQMPITCPTDYYLTGLALKQNATANTWKYAYNCSTNGRKTTCTDQSTPWAEIGPLVWGKYHMVDFLDRHKPSCPTGQLMNKLSLEVNDNKSMIRYNYGCCSFK